MSKKLRILPLAAVIFLTVSGGPYGLEPLLSYAGRDAALLLLIITPILWDIPAILTVLELNSMMPVEGGYYVWVKQTLGPRFGFYEGWWTWLYTFVDLAIYPVLFITYASYFWSQAEVYKIPIGLLIIWLGALLNILGISPIGKLSMLLGVMVISPFVIMGIAALTQLDTLQPLPKPSMQGITFPALGMALYTVMWNFFGWDNATTYAGEVSDAPRTYIRSIVVAFCAVIGVYAITVLAMQASGIVASELNAGGFPTLGEKIGGKWLGTLIAIGGLASALGLYNAVLLSVSRVPEVMAADRFLPKALSKLHPRFGTPYISIIVCAMVVSGMIFWSFESLIVIDVTLYGAGLFLEFVTLIVLRIRQPEATRPFRIPMGVPALCLMYLLPICVYCIALSGAFMDGGDVLVPAVFAALAIGSAELAWQVSKMFRNVPSPGKGP
jgi:amino acid transporter